MAPTDYNKKKPLNVTSVSGTPTVEKAQPVLINNNVIDNFEDGNVDGWVGDTGNFSAQQSTIISGSFTGDLNAASESVSVNKDFSQSNQNNLEFKIRIGARTGTSGDDVTINVDDDAGNRTAVLLFNDSDGSLSASGTDTAFDYSANTTYTVRIENDFANNEYELFINGISQGTFSFFDGATDNISNFELVNNTANSGLTRSLFIDDIIFSNLDDSKTGNGDIIIDDTNISGESDIAFYDQDGNLLPYELENPEVITADGLTGELVAWVYSSWTRDGSTQAQVVYGDGPTSSEENVTGTWNNSGQNAVMVQHLQDEPLTATDSTANDNDGAVNGAVSTAGQFDGAASFDGTDDEILVNDSSSLDITGQLTVVSALTVGDSTKAGDQMIVAKDDDSNGRSYTFSWAMQDGTKGLRIYVNGGGSPGSNELNSSFYPETGEKHIVAGVWDNSGSDTATVYANGSSLNSISGINSIPTSTSQLGIGSRTFDGAENFFNGKISEARLYNDAKSSQWLQADYDASPKAGQVFFTQDAAETTVATTEVTFTQDITVKDRDVSKQLSQDIIIENPNVPEQFTQDVAVVEQIQKQFNNDVTIQEQDVTQTFTQDITVAARGVEKTFTQEVAVQQQDQTAAFDQDLFISEKNQESFSQEIAIEKRDRTKQLSQDLILEDPNVPEQFTQDVAVKQRDTEVTFTQSIIVAEKDVTQQFTQDVVISDRIEKTFTQDVIIAKQPAPDVQNPLTVNILTPTRTYWKNLNPGKTYVEVKDINTS